MGAGAAERFFEACETGKGWARCRQYCHSDATFTAQADALADAVDKRRQDPPYDEDLERRRDDAAIRLGLNHFAERVELRSGPWGTTLSASRRRARHHGCDFRSWRRNHDHGVHVGDRGQISSTSGKQSRADGASPARKPAVPPTAAALIYLGRSRE
ncbi:hypothetical protein LI99_07910 [Mycolicibacterium smegmatis]|uniref:Uncharacterized protein n=1 Tax=Mycolicibacterium smegmatis (strain ATCC 700084 / mc(2)155) TaxID=246196 RepID=A0QSS5_MYCS2|nr:hypothetical protein MSMEG_1584 [Mycolicibacterium smegmatis MC2 155]AIU13440.1 hypothetical protein LI99_07910 [Mycolicibacterium smegmatis]AIU06815.1 hypothetical protein LJ00_07910 [Mycolicibacterium smegmatis MC2 155]AIU20064.1 hypothetical protein LI98_07910 [Mycolicibacterium smegmatis]TBH44598.1 hypothetical protein EYS45_15485 [Mycolicibacterium smegmatis MC2 155]